MDNKIKSLSILDDSDKTLFDKDKYIIPLYLIFGSYKKKKPPKLSCLSRNRRLFFRIFFSTFNGFYCMRLYFLHLANLRTDDPSL